jgi:hypothetical protein
MTCSLIDGLVVVARRIGHCDHRTSPQDFHEHMVGGHRVNTRKELHRIFDAAIRVNLEFEVPLAP